MAKMEVPIEAHSNSPSGAVRLEAAWCAARKRHGHGRVARHLLGSVSFVSSNICCIDEEILDTEHTWEQRAARGGASAIVQMSPRRSGLEGVIDEVVLEILRRYEHWCSVQAVELDTISLTTQRLRCCLPRYRCLEGPSKDTDATLIAAHVCFVCSCRMHGLGSGCEPSPARTDHHSPVT